MTPDDRYTIRWQGGWWRVVPPNAYRLCPGEDHMFETESAALAYADELTARWSDTLTAPDNASLDAAMLALSEVTVALATLYPLLSILPGPPEAHSFVEDGMEAAGRARRHLLALRETATVPA